MTEWSTAKRCKARIALLALAPVLALLLPQIAGVQGALLVPVRYAKVALPEQAPAVISLALPVAELTVAPASLGYFSPAGEFVYSADVDRGLIYGYKPGTSAPVYVVEISAPEQAREFLDLHLERIRNWTRELNTRRNRLRLERQQLEALPASHAVASLASRFFETADAAGGDSIDRKWLARGVGYGAGTAADLAAALGTQAGKRARMKELYYAALEARLELELAQCELQLALARLPERSGPQLLPQPTALQIASLQLNHLDELKQEWTARQQRLEACLAANPAVKVAAEPLAVTTFTPAADLLPRYGMPELEPAPPPAPPDLRVDLQLAAQAAQHTLWQAELAAARSALYRLAAVERQVAQAAGQEQQGLPRFSVDEAMLDQPALSLGAAAQVDALAADPALITGLLLKLERLYEGGRGRPGPPAVEEQLQDLRPKGEEVPCGLLAVDHCVRSTAGKPMLAQQLDSILKAPDAYGIAALDPGYLSFMRWYAGLVQHAAVAGTDQARPTASASP